MFLSIRNRRKEGGGETVHIDMTLDYDLCSDSTDRVSTPVSRLVKGQVSQVVGLGSKDIC